MNRLADAAGLSRGAISNLVNGRKSPTLATIEKLAVALDMDVALLLSAEGRTKKP